jgi:hypothetical protein
MLYLQVAASGRENLNGTDWKEEKKHSITTLHKNSTHNSLHVVHLEGDLIDPMGARLHCPNHLRHFVPNHALVEGQGGGGARVRGWRVKFLRVKRERAITTLVHQALVEGTTLHGPFEALIDDRPTDAEDVHCDKPTFMVEVVHYAHKTA